MFRRFCPFCGNEVATGKRQDLVELFDRFGTALDYENTYVQVIPRPEGDMYAVIGDTERLDRHMKWLQAA